MLKNPIIHLRNRNTHLPNIHKSTNKNHTQNTHTHHSNHKRSRHLSDSEDDNHDDRSLLCVRDKM